MAVAAFPQTFGNFGNIKGMIANTFQIGADLQSRAEYAQIFS